MAKSFTYTIDLTSVAPENIGDYLDGKEVERKIVHEEFVVDSMLAATEHFKKMLNRGQIETARQIAEKTVEVWPLAGKNMLRQLAEI